jgi:hypothetical protein
VDNTDYPAALERRKVYQIIPDSHAELHQLLRVIDESGEDYLYPATYFLSVSLPPDVQEAILRAA